MMNDSVRPVPVAPECVADLAEHLTANQVRFLEGFEKYGTMRRAAKFAGLSRGVGYVWMRRDKNFAAALNTLRTMLTEELADHAVHRATVGRRRLKFNSKGDAIINPETGEHYAEYHPSDQLLMFLMKANDPEKYGDKIDVKGTYNLGALSEAELGELAARNGVSRVAGLPPAEPAR
ncbi:MAG: hypothetical protein AAGJ97_00445 [Planctomycetota bacterium]